MNEERSAPASTEAETEHASVDLSDDEMSLIAAGLRAIEGEEPGALDLINKLGLQSL